ncbi:NUDIX hydrolase [Roseospirillum parvum]|uniref:ADP-ribose pyrophosphatase YjhB, NUDIX family n=1 Tax=Roseospirillum parvum TaxID=83401 RepID=A0A1G7XUP5_9PROT|nr:NUDIX hydrolase [Roseospirillum parvum]SDG87470.1 ADP-ribose pyrophosphatase YjhB, NUDIX family [Roseospirillum parvum]
MPEATDPDRRLPQIGVGAVVLSAGRVLLIERGKAPAEGTWSLPGGLQELGETVAQAVAREVAEETGLEVEVGPLVEVVDWIERHADGGVGCHFTILDHLARPRDPAALPVAGSDARQARWVDLGALADHALHPVILRVINAALAHPAAATAR